MNIRTFLIVFFAAALFVGVYSVSANSEDDIVFPVAELGNCESKEQCHAYCDELGNLNSCIAFAEEHNLMSAEEIAEARKFQRIGVTAGPGGCRGKAQCEAYCEDVSNIDECLAFAEEHGVLEGGELEEARRVAAALRQGAQLPGGCRNKTECEAYCEEPSHINECLAFAEAAGFMSPEELEEARRIAPLMARGEMPGGCRSRGECEAYCSQENHIEECVAFFQKAGFMSAEEAEMFRKTGGKGPGSCQGREECEAFCNNPTNQKECFAFAKEHDLIPEEELRNIEEGIGRFQEGLENAPPEVAQCLKDTIGEEALAKIEAGTFLPNLQIGEQMQRCFEDFLPRSFDGEHGEGEGFSPEGERRMPPPESMGCVERILGERDPFVGPPGPELEQRIRAECFPQEQQSRPEDFERFVPPPDGEIPEEFRGDFDQQFQEEFERQYREQFEQQFQENFENQFEQEFHEEPPPEARNPHQRFLGAVWEAMKPGLARLIAR